MPTAPEPPISRRELGRATLARQLLLERAQIGVADAVGALAGMQAQEPRPPFVGLWSRVDGFAPAQLLEALRSGTLVRGPLFRATLHLVRAEDWAAFRPTLQPVLARALSALGERGAAIDVDAVAATARGLLSQSPRTAAELRTLLHAAHPEHEERALGYAVRTAVPLTMVATEDPLGFPREARFALAEPQPPLGTAEQLALRYLAAFGPASVADAQEWSGVRGLAPVFAALRDQLVSFVDEHGRELFDLPDSPRPPADSPAPARYLPDFDNLMLAHADRTRVIAQQHRRHLTTKNLRVNAIALHDGEACATWTVKRTAKAATLELTPFAKLSKPALAELEAEAMALLEATEPGAKGAFALRPPAA
jgi:Winged helix DNA-binding domain